MLRIAMVSAVVASAFAQMPTSCSGQPNMNPAIPAKPQLVNKVPNGSRYVVAPANFSAPVTVMHVYGTAYEMGVAYGQLAAPEIAAIVPLALDYLKTTINSTISFLPEPLRDWIATYGLDIALNLTVNATRPYTPQHFLDTLQGMADGSGMDVLNLTYVSLIPELIKAQCSMMGAWGPATTNAGLLQLRALDWTTDGPFQQYPLVMTFHPNAGDGNTFTTVGWMGFLGAITGWSSSGMAISEKLWDSYKGLDNIFGYPFNFLLADILQYDNDTDSALSRIATASRTCSIWIGIGDEKNNEFKTVAYSWSEVDIYNPNNFPYYPNHDKFNDLLFINKHVQPSGEPCMNDLIHWLYGSLDAQAIYQYITAMEMTGDMHIAIYDFKNKDMYVSNAEPYNAVNQTVVKAYTRPFLQFDMEALWSTTL